MVKTEHQVASVETGEAGHICIARCKCGGWTRQGGGGSSDAFVLVPATHSSLDKHTQIQTATFFASTSLIFTQGTGFQ